VRSLTLKPFGRFATACAALALVVALAGCGRDSHDDDEQTGVVGDFEESPVGFSAIPDAKPFYGPAPFTSKFSVDEKNAKGKVKILWDFNDGSPRTEEASPSHTFERPGQYTVGVSVTDVDGEIEGGSLVIRSMTKEEWEGLQAKRRAAGIMDDY
jgi:hypothetical protein